MTQITQEPLVYLRDISGESGWKRYGDGVLQLERVLYPPGSELALPEGSWPGFFTESGAVACGSIKDGRLIGFVVGNPANSERIATNYRTRDGKFLFHYDKIGQDSLYVIAIDVDPDFHGRGIGSNMMGLFSDLAKERGYKSLSGHFEPDTSAKIMRKLNSNDTVELLCPGYPGNHLFMKVKL